MIKTLNEGSLDQYHFITDYIDRYGVTPDFVTFNDRFKELDYRMFETNEPPEALAQRLYDTYSLALSVKSYKELRELYTKNDYTKARELVQKLYSTIRECTLLQPVDIVNDTSRYNDYVNKTKDLDTFYVTTGFPELDDALQGGWDRKNDLVTIVARPGQGKSWCLLKCALGACLQGLRVGLYSGEMDEKMVGYRFDTLLGHISNTAITRGQIVVQNEYKDYIDSIKSQCKGSLLVLTPEKNGNKFATVSDLQTFVETENLDMLCVDQYSLMDDERKGKDSTVKTANLSKDLKRLQTLKHIPIIAVSQQNRGKQDEDEDLDVSRIAQSDRIGQDSSIVLFIEQNFNLQTLKISIAKNRNGQYHKPLRYKIDLNNGLFTYDDGNSNTSVKEIETGYDATKEDKNEFIGEDIF